MAKRLSQREAVQLLGIERGETNRVMPLTEADVAKLIRRELVTHTDRGIQLTAEGYQALRRWGA